MSYVYFLRSVKDGEMYIGSTKCLRNRIREHIKGNVPSTKNRGPLNIIGWRKFYDIAEAAQWEKKYKNSHGQIERDIKNKKIIMSHKA
ncbi:MAG: nuclease superfamily protein [Candidatus Berkelbacteria bacterium]|nr:nuclease superfamily protein [Candidatus Berkelbacteria bacterium]